MTIKEMVKQMKKIQAAVDDLRQRSGFKMDIALSARGSDGKMEWYCEKDIINVMLNTHILDDMKIRRFDDGDVKLMLTMDKIRFYTYVSDSEFNAIREGVK